MVWHQCVLKKVETVNAVGHGILNDSCSAKILFVGQPHEEGLLEYMHASYTVG